MNLFTKIGMLACTPTIPPTIHSSRLFATRDKLNEQFFLLQIIGCLIYLTNTYPNITFIVNNLSQFVSSPTLDHLADHIIHCYKGAPSNGIFLNVPQFYPIKSFR